MKVSGILPLMHPTVNFIESCYGCSQYKTFIWRVVQLTLIGGKGRQQLLIEPTITNLNKLQFTQLQMFRELV